MCVLNQINKQHQQQEIYNTFKRIVEKLAIQFSSFIYASLMILKNAICYDYFRKQLFANIKMCWELITALSLCIAFRFLCALSLGLERMALRQAHSTLFWIYTQMWISASVHLLTALFFYIQLWIIFLYIFSSSSSFIFFFFCIIYFISFFTFHFF